MSEVEAIKVLSLAILGLSLPATGFLLYRKLTIGHLLPYEPRWPVSWGAVGAVLAMALLLLSLLSLAIQRLPMDQAAMATEIAPSEFVQQALMGCVVYVLMVLLIAGALVRSVGATWEDLGLPRSFSQGLKDVGTGLLAGVASLAPVYAIQFLLVIAIKMPSSHPTLEQLLQTPSPAVLLAVFLSAGVMAPVFEEFVFRLLFQGWLERTEDEALTALGKMHFVGDEKQKEPEEQDSASSPLLEEALPDPSNPYASLPEPIKKLRNRKGAPPTPPAESAPGLPHGWAPVLISSFVFSLVHISQGAAFISLFPLALVLGHLYQRTHRILPSVAAHMTFNVCSLTLAWLQTQAA